MVSVGPLTRLSRECGIATLSPKGRDYQELQRRHCRQGKATPPQNLTFPVSAGAPAPSDSYLLLMTFNDDNLLIMIVHTLAVNCW